MYAIVEISGKQYKVQEGDIVFVDRLETAEEGSKVTFDKVLLVSDGKKVTIGQDTVKGAKVEASVIGHGKAKKVLVFKYKAKKLGTSRAFLLNMALHEQMQKEIDITPVGEELTINQRWEHVFKNIKHE